MKMSAKIKKDKPDQSKIITKERSDKINTWRNALDIKPSKGYQWIFNNFDDIYGYIQEYENIDSRRSHLNNLAQMMKYLNKESLYKKLSEEATDLNKEIVKNADNQELSEDRKLNYVSYEDLIKVREERKKLWKLNPENNKLNQQYLILALYTMQPPLRQDYKDMQIVEERPAEDDKNYLWKKANKYVIVLNKDKVYKTYGRAEIPLSTELSSIIDDSLAMFPREYILSTLRDGNKELGKQNFERIVNEIFSPKKVSVDILRSAYISHMYADPNFSRNQKKELAELMRHSIEIADQTYNKINISIDEKDAGEKDDEDKELAQKDLYMKKYREDKKAELTEKRKAKYAIEKDMILKKKILYSLNKEGNLSKPTAKSISKYNLVYDDENKKWA